MRRLRQHALVVPQNCAEESPKTIVQPKPNCLILVSTRGVLMEQAIFELAAPDLTAPPLSVVALCYNKVEVRAALHQDTFDRADPDFVWVSGSRMER